MGDEHHVTNYGILGRTLPRNDCYAGHLGELLSAYKDSSLASPHLVEEVVSGEDGKLWARVWEAMLYDHLLQQTVFLIRITLTLVHFLVATTNPR